MENTKIVFNGIFYLILTSFFGYIFYKEKELVDKINKKKDVFCNKIINNYGITSEGKKKFLKRTVHYTESLGTALILVLIIQRFYIGNFMIPTGSMIPTIVPKDRVFGNMVIYKFTEPKREDIVVFKEPIQNKVLYTKRLMGLPGEDVEIYDGKLYINKNSISQREYSSLGNINGEKWRVPKKGDRVEIIPKGDYNSVYKKLEIDIDEVQKDLKENPGAVEKILPEVEFRVNGEKTGMLLDLINNKEIIKKLFSGEVVEINLEENYYMVLGDNTDNSYDSRMWGFVAQSRIRGKAFVRFWPLNRISLLK